jgi:hypothetical protein
LTNAEEEARGELELSSADDNGELWTEAGLHSTARLGNYREEWCSSVEGEAKGKCRTTLPASERQEKEPKAATWKKTPEKLAPRGSGCREYDRQVLHKEFSHELK